jgi:hypothetical protein
VVSGQGVKMDNHKVQTVIDWPIPSNVKQLRGFLGLTGYYRRFIKFYVTIASSFTDLLKKDIFKHLYLLKMSFFNKSVNEEAIVV